METIKEAKEFLRLNADDGCICPCCDQRVKFYKNKLSARKAIYLIKLYHLTKDGNYVHALSALEANSGEYALLRHWGLIEESQEAPTEDVKSNGLWRITEKGKKFVLGDIKVPRHATVFDNRFLGYRDEKDLVGIKDALGMKFSYFELMNL